MPQPGTRSRMARMVRANSSAPPSARSSRLTLVIDREFQAHGFDSGGHALRLIVIHRQRRAFLDRAESAAARAHVAQDHEGGGAVVPAFAHVGASRALANRVQPQPPDEFLQIAIVLSPRCRRAQPLRARRAACSGTGLGEMETSTWFHYKLQPHSPQAVLDISVTGYETPKFELVRGAEFGGFVACHRRRRHLHPRRRLA